MLRFYLRKRHVILIFFIFLSIYWVCPAFAHRVTVFAWIEGDTVFVESKFAGGRKVKQGDVIVSDLNGNQVLTGKTNDDGEFSFKIPKKTALKIVLSAGMGHQGEWTIPIEEIEEITADQTPPVAEKSVAEKPVAESPVIKTDDSPEKKQPVSSPGVSQEDIQIAVEKALDKKLKPVIKMLADSQDRKPSFNDIIGGIGYILGLMGIAAYFNFRRKNRSLDCLNPDSSD